MAGKRAQERAHVAQWVKRLQKAPRSRFPREGLVPRTEAPDAGGVYFIRSARGRIFHVGKASKLRRRLNDHLRSTTRKSYSSFIGGEFGGDGAQLRRGYSHAFVAIRNYRTRALVEHLAVGLLCPKHLGTHERLEE